MAGDKDRKKGDKLSIEDTVRARLRVSKRNVVGGVDPYDGAIVEKPPGQKRDLRKLSEWIEAKRLAEQRKGENSDPAAVPTAGEHSNDSKD